MSVILVVEHETSFIYQLRRFFHDYGIRHDLKVARYADEAILYLKGIGIYGNRSHYPLPLLVLLDVNNPDASDLHVLSWMREQNEFDKVPIVILVETTQNTGIQSAFDMGANAFLVKRNDLHELAEMIDTLALEKQIPWKKSPQSKD